MNEETQSHEIESPGAEEASDDNSAVDPEIESEARKQGWVPKENYRGDESDWMDAQSFVKKSREINAILKQNNTRLKRDLDTAKSELAELKLTTKEFAAEFAKMKDNAYKKAIADLKAQRRDALKEDNLELVDDLEERIDSLKQEQAQKTAAPKQEQNTDKPDMTAFNDWHRENKWYDEENEPDMFDAAEAAALRLSRTDKSLTGRAFMDKVTEIVKAKFPEKFENPRRKSAPHEGGGARGEPKNGRSYAALPNDAKQACDRYVKQGIMTKEQYLEAYEW